MKLFTALFILISSLAFGQATTYTTNYRYAKPGDGSTSWGSEIRSNYDKLDAQLKTIEDSLSLWVKYTKTFSDFSDASSSKSVALFTAPIGAVIEAVVVRHTASFTGGALTGYTINVESGSLHPNVDVFAAPTDFTTANVPYSVESFTTPTTITAEANSTGGNLSEATAGSVDIYVKYTVLP